MRNEMKSAFGGKEKGYNLERSRKGFTLIELLVVIAIIAILATVVIINVTGARAKAQKAKVADGMATAVKVAASCNSFGGIINPFTDGGDVCNTVGISDTTEKEAAKGKYPVLPDSYSIDSVLDSITIGVKITAPDGSTLLSTINNVGSWVETAGSGGGSYDVTLASQSPLPGSVSSRKYFDSFDLPTFTAVYSENISSCTATFVGAVPPSNPVCSVSGNTASLVISSDARSTLDVTINSVVTGKTVVPVLFYIAVIE